MAARTRKTRIDDFTRERIKTSQIINRLTDHMVGKVDMSQTQVQAAKILLGKSLPDLAAVQHSGDAQNPVSLVVTGVRRPDDES